MQYITPLLKIQQGFLIKQDCYLTSLPRCGLTSRFCCHLPSLPPSHAATFPRCFAATSTRCLAATSPRCLTATSPRCLAATSPRCLARSSAQVACNGRAIMLRWVGRVTSFFTIINKYNRCLVWSGCVYAKIELLSNNR